MTLTEFLLARIAEDEARFLAVAEGDPALGDGGDDHWESEFGPWSFNGTEEPFLSAVLTVKPSRVLAECEAKRRIVEHYQYSHASQLLAAVYADHPDYDETWQP